jgi:hypothetical protein
MRPPRAKMASTEIRYADGRISFDSGSASSLILLRASPSMRYLAQAQSGAESCSSTKTVAVLQSESPLVAVGAGELHAGKA